MPILAKDVDEFPANLLADLPTSVEERCWRIVYTKPRQEKALARQLLATETPFYLPLVPKDNLIRKRKVRSFLPMFDGYLFLYCSEEDRYQVLTTNRVLQVLEVIDEAQLNRDLLNIRELIASDKPLTLESRLQAGTLVRVKRGSLMGLEGTIIRRQGASRLVVAVNYLQQGISVEIDDFMVEEI